MTIMLECNLELLVECLQAKVCVYLHMTQESREDVAHGL